jgi:hypothetical protein
MAPNNVYKVIYRFRDYTSKKSLQSGNTDFVVASAGDEGHTVAAVVSIESMAFP